MCSILFAGGFQAQPARAQAPDAQTVMAAVNALRASRGLAPYTVDAWLMAYAQQHSDYQASIGSSTHTHSDGSVPWETGIQENVASGSVDFIDINFIVYQVWADAVHMKPMVGFPGGAMGVGVAISGDTAYYTLNVIPEGTEISLNTVSSAATSADTAEPAISEEGLVTSTPLPDGAVYHVIGYGQTLWDIAIAYGVTVQKIRDFNNIPADSTDIYAGQKLLIKLPGTPYYTATPPATQTPLASQTLVPTQTFTPAPSRTSTRTVTAEPTTRVEQATPTLDALSLAAVEPAAGTGWRTALGGALLALAGFGLGVWAGLTWAERKQRVLT